MFLPHLIRHWLELGSIEFSEAASAGFLNYVLGLLTQSTIRIVLLIVVGAGFVISVSNPPRTELIVIVGIPIIVYMGLELSILNQKLRAGSRALTIRIALERHEFHHELKNRLEEFFKQAKEDMSA